MVERQSLGPEGEVGVRIRSGLLAATILLVLTPAVRAWYPYGEKYNRWQEDRPLMAGALHNSVPQDHLTERMARFKAGGLNTVIWWKLGNSKHIFRAAHDRGLEWAGGPQGGPPVIEDVLKIPGCAFIFAGDEPSSERELDDIAEICDWMWKEHPGIPVFANLSIVKIDHDLYIETCKPDIFSFDHYPLMRNGLTQRSYTFNLAWGRQTARTYRLPYWMFLQAYGREQEEPNHAYRIPGEADTRFLIFSFLAHGGTGIMYYHYYGHPEGMVIDREVIKPGRDPVDRHKYENTVMSRAWYGVRDATPEVQNLARALINLRTRDPIAYAGDGRFWDHPAPHYSRHNPKRPVERRRFRPRGALKAVRVSEGEDMGLLVGLFDDEKGEEYFMVVNLAHGLNMSKMDGARTVRLTFDPSVQQIERLNRMTGRVETLRTKQHGGVRVLDIQLEGGTGDLFKWSNGNPWDLREK